MISLEQWRALVAVVDAGGYARAADALNKTQSSVTYAVQKVESLLGVKAFEIRGRRARLTPVGEVLAGWLAWYILALLWSLVCVVLSWFGDLIPLVCTSG